VTKSAFRDPKFSYMLSATPTAGKLKGSILPEYSQLVLGCLLSTLLLCAPIVVYTNHIKQMGTLAGPVFDSRGSPAETPASQNIVGIGELRKSVSNVQQQTTGAPADTAPQQTVAGSGSARDNKEGNTSASQQKGTRSRPVSLSATARDKSASQRFSKTWARNRLPRVQTASIAIWRENSKRPSKMKSKSSGSYFTDRRTRDPA
jgi:hypothetical protein